MAAYAAVVEFLIAALVLLVLAYTAWVFRWYWRTLLTSWQSDGVETPDPQPKGDPVGLRRIR